MLKMHDLNVASVAKNTDETVVITFDVPEELKADYRYKQGQHLTLCRDFNGEELRRSYSICASVAENTLKVAVRNVEGGRFSGYANDDLKAGDKIAVIPPAGHFFVDLDEKQARTYVAFAAGSGITPIMSIIKTTLETEPKSKFMLFYGNRTAASTIFLRELGSLKNQHMDRFSYWHFLSQQDTDVDLFNGRLDAEKLEKIIPNLMDPNFIDHAFVCGPDALIDTVVGVLKKVGMSDDTVHFEKFLSEGQVANVSARAKAKGGTAKMTLIIDGDEMVLNGDRETAILDNAIKGDLDVPFACKGGVCCTCRAKVISGEVDMVLNQGLEPEEVEAGYVLTCQSYAVSDEVVLSYDE